MTLKKMAGRFPDTRISGGVPGLLPLPWRDPHALTLTHEKVANLQAFERLLPLFRAVQLGFTSDAADWLRDKP